MEEFLDRDLKAMIEARLQLVSAPAQSSSGGDMAARAHLLCQVVELFYDNSKHHYAGPSERDGLGQVLDAAKAHEMQCIHFLGKH